mmetsp:Transcript_26986/g.62078  ORF Transcript_26986/g.62078 Transcript_26986/m.62078 type:complete len:232 (-) Transcript_26986:764-1459(-)
MVSYQFVGKINYGPFGPVTKIQRRADGRQFVMKEIEYESYSDTAVGNLMSCVNSLRGFHHPSILQCYDRTIDEKQKKLTIVTEYCAGGSLANLIETRRQSGKHFDEAYIWTILGQLVAGLHKSFRFSSKESKKNILHNDIRPDHIFLDKKYNAKIFNFDVHLAQTNSNGRRGDSRYMSVERQHGGKVDAKSTVWGLGCIIYEMATFHTPFTSKGINEENSSTEMHGSISPM